MLYHDAACSRSFFNYFAVGNDSSKAGTVSWLKAVVLDFVEISVELIFDLYGADMGPQQYGNKYIGLYVLASIFWSSP